MGDTSTSTQPSPPSRTVLYLLDYTSLGGGETSFLAFLAALLKSVPDIRPVVVLPGEGPLAERLLALGVQTHLVPFPRRLRLGPLPWFSVAAARQLGGLMDETRPALIHANNFFGMLYAGPGARRRGLPLLWTCHGAFDIDTRIKVWAARRYAAAVSCVSGAVRAAAARRLGEKPRTVTDYLGIIPYCEVYPEDGRTREAIRAAVRTELGAGEREPLIGVVGRFQPVKGHVTLLDALPAVRRRIPGLKVWLVGDAFDTPEEQAHKRLIQERVRSEGLGECVRFLGFRDDARRLMRALDCLAIPSAAESFSMAAVEGLEAGIPVVGPDGWGPREIIEAPRTGLRFRPGDPGDLAAKLIAALTGEGEGAAFDPQAGPARVAALFTVRAHLDRTLAMYRELATK